MLYSYQSSSVVVLSVCLSVGSERMYCEKTAYSIEMSFGVVSQYLSIT